MFICKPPLCTPVYRKLKGKKKKKRDPVFTRRRRVVTVTVGACGGDQKAEFFLPHSEFVNPL